MRDVAEARDAAEALARRWGISDDFEGLFVESDLSYVEHVVHELTHAVTLRLGLVDNLSGRVAHEAGAYGDDGRGNEALTFAVELHALPRIVAGLPDDWRGVVEDALEIQIGRDYEAWDLFEEAADDPDEIEDMIEEVADLFWSEERKR